MSHEVIKIMVVDDSSVIRGFLTRFIESDPDLKVVATAANGQIAVEQMDRYVIDVVILDIEMPVMNGLDALPKIKAKDKAVHVIMASTLTKENAAVTLRALSMGASEALAKPSSATELNAAEDFRLNLISKAKLLGLDAQKRRQVDKTKAEPQPLTTKNDTKTTTSTTPSPAAPPATVTSKSLLSPQAPLTLRPVQWTGPADIIAIGSSTGGPQALVEFLGHLKGSITQPVFITQHMPPTFTTILADQITKSTGFDCREGTDNEAVSQGRFYIAPGNHHMVIKNNHGVPTIHLNQDPPENFCRPAVDPMLRSLGECYAGKRILVIILTGMGADGLKGAEKIATSHHVMVLAQDEASSVVWGMPGAVAKAGLCTKIGTLKELADSVRSLTK